MVFVFTRQQVQRAVSMKPEKKTNDDVDTLTILMCNLCSTRNSLQRYDIRQRICAYIYPAACVFRCHFTSDDNIPGCRPMSGESHIDVGASSVVNSVSMDCH